MTNRALSPLRPLRVSGLFGSLLLRGLLRLLRRPAGPRGGDPDRAHREASGRVKRSECNGIRNPAAERSSPAPPPPPPATEVEVFTVYAGPALTDLDAPPAEVVVSVKALTGLVEGDEYIWRAFLNIVETGIQRTAP